ncbi:hypothetical protein [Albimonas pacifica]|nr:hypothetical protein [Albimonas pacifica]
MTKAKTQDAKNAVLAAHAAAAAIANAAAATVATNVHVYAAKACVYAAAARATASTVDDAFRDATDAAKAAAEADTVAYVEQGSDQLALLPLWLTRQPQQLLELWNDLRRKLLDAGDGWDVWVGWYEARLSGGAIDWDLERDIALISDALWEGAPRELNARISELIAERAAALPQGEVLDLSSSTARISSFPVPEDDADIVADAVNRVADALDDFREDGLGNRVPELKATVRRLDRALTSYRANPRRLHDDFNLAALEIGREMKSLGDLGEDSRLIAFRDTCAQSTIDMRIGVKAVAELVAERFKHQSQMPPQDARQAYRVLLEENEDTLDPPLAEEMAEDLDILDQSGATEGAPILGEAARDAFYRLATRLAWLIRFGSMRPEQIVELARRVGRSVDEIERLVSMYRLGEIAWELVSFILKLF